MMLADPPDTLLIAPESLEAMLGSSKVSAREHFADVQAIVVDEVHAFAGDDRGRHLLAVNVEGRRLRGGSRS
jgi:ATP-dependent Lhr-like helicase